ncbi:MAG: cache domain-containing protein, partial [Chromatiaceae bacterium]|nr:cache domain-containing protein [Chromatiaceae bacterium]
MAITTYAELRMSELAGAQRAESIESARQLILNTAEEQAGAIDAMIAEPLSATRTLAQAFVSAARKEVSELTEQDWVRLRSRFKRMEKVSEVAVSSLRPLIEAAERGELTLEEAQGQALERLRAMRYDGENYFWVQDRAAPYPRMIMHPFAPELEGRVMDDPRYNNAMGRDENFFVALDAIAAREGKGYIHYAWPRPGETEPTPKLAFGQLIPEWDWVVASGMWIDRMSFYTRNDIDLILRSVLRENPGFLAVYTAWEPNAFDGRDSDFVNAPGSDASGRFISYWSRGASGAIELEPLVDYETPGAGDYYMLPKQRGLEQLINPYLYPVQGREVLITSLVAPIVMGGEFRGIAGVDLSLEPFQRFVEEAARRLYGGRAQVAIIAHDGTLVGLSADAGQVGQPHADAETLRAALQGGEPLVMEQGDRMVAVAPIRPGKTDTPWAIQISVPTEVITALADEASTTARRVGLVMALVSVACVLAGIGLMFWVTRGIVRRLASVVRTMHDIAEGEGDLTRELDA